MKGGLDLNTQNPGSIECQDASISICGSQLNVTVELQALNNINLEIKAGHGFGSLLGPNGSGKTTLVRILTTLLKPDQGSVKVGGFDVLKEPNSVRNIFGLAGQYPAVDENLTGRENLIMIGQLYHMGTVSR